MGNPNKDDYLGLRRKLDGSDPLMRGLYSASFGMVKSLQRGSRLLEP